MLSQLTGKVKPLGEDNFFGNREPPRKTPETSETSDTLGDIIATIWVCLKICEQPDGRSKWEVFKAMGLWGFIVFQVSKLPKTQLLIVFLQQV